MDHLICISKGNPPKGRETGSIRRRFFSCGLFNGNNKRSGRLTGESGGGGGVVEGLRAEP
ncbi:hypothetical protein QJS04_geneDACA005544 [Acorus gramineus]|uniref:Uncharacterized protein n=1 Tax=Acorus gramineus TaxID=55184 RepID=A0AAV9A5C1_ACOGR|nr:hypothetical protein QJS04_geneDACA005544 [Acorus gramineus]